MPRNVIIFGATGAVGSSAALSAHQSGAKVSLAMRDPSKALPPLLKDHESTLERVQADLTDPASIQSAVQKTGAKHAFIYLVFGAPDNMRSGIEALKAAGIESVVMLSSFSVQGDIRSIPATEFIAYKHAQVEIVLEEVFGTQNYVAVRPGFFASNAGMLTGQIKSGDLRVAYPDAKFDWIVQEDIGRVAGRVVAGATQEENGKHFIYLFGPEQLSLGDGAKVVGNAIGKDVQVTRVSEDEAVAAMVKEGMAEPFAKAVNDMWRDAEQGQGLINSPVYQGAVDNIQKYGGKPATTFAQWAEKNTHVFA